MNEKLKKYKYIKIFVNIIYVISMIIFPFYLVVKVIDQLFELDLEQFLLSFSVFLILYLILCFIICFIAIIWHEFGHLIFGLKAKLKFVSFNIWRYILYRENNKLKIKKANRIPNIGGYCYMTIDENEKYNKSLMKFYFLGGIIFNFILFIISLILIIFTNNIYLKLIYILNVAVNAYFALYNLIPSIEKSGIITDGLQVMYFNNDEEYLNTMFKLQKLQLLIENGVELKDIDSSLFSKPQKFKTKSDIQNAMIYIDYLTDKNQYNEASEYAKKVLVDANELLLKTEVITLKLQLIISIFSSNDDVNKIKEIWDEDIKKYLDLMGNVSPIYIGINYLYATLVEKNEDNSKKYLNQFQQLKVKLYEKYELEETEKLINEVDKKLKVKDSKK